MSKINLKKSAGFTLLEILLVVGIISILAGIVILAINPTKQLGDTRNAQRRSDVMTILNAVYQFSIDKGGYLPTDDGTIEGDVVILESDSTTACSTINTDHEIMKEDTASGSGEINLYTSLVGSEELTTYLITIPVDPLRSASDVDTGYHIFKNSAGRITVCAPHSVGEGSVDGTINPMISVTR
jgi:prepilin-type N-terminal cleavage/methylation domain-containing protein